MANAVRWRLLNKWTKEKHAQSGAGRIRAAVEDKVHYVKFHTRQDAFFIF